MRYKASNSFDQAVCAVRNLSASLENSTENSALQAEQAWLYLNQDLSDNQSAELPRKDYREDYSRYNSSIL